MDPKPKIRDILANPEQGAAGTGRDRRLAPGGRPGVAGGNVPVSREVKNSVYGKIVFFAPPSTWGTSV